jgi:hypothetical protein
VIGPEQAWYEYVYSDGLVIRFHSRCERIWYEERRASRR